MTKEKADKKRHDKILKAIDERGKICYTCQHYVECRIPEQIAKHGEFKGFCVYPDKGDSGERLKESVIVSDDSTCDKWVDVFPRPRDEDEG